MSQCSVELRLSDHRQGVYPLKTLEQHPLVPSLPLTLPSSSLPSHPFPLLSPFRQRQEPSSVSPSPVYCVVQGDLAEQGALLRKDVFSVWENRKDQRSIRGFKSRTRHVFLYERLILLCKKKDDSAVSVDRSATATYSLKNSLLVSHSISDVIDHTLTPVPTH